MVGEENREKVNVGVEVWSLLLNIYRGIYSITEYIDSETITIRATDSLRRLTQTNWLKDTSKVRPS